MTQPFRCSHCDFEGPLSIFKGGSWEIVIEAFTRNCGEEGDLNLDGFEGRMQLREAVDKPVILSPTVSITGNRISLSLTDEETAELVLPGKNPDEETWYWYDMFLYDEEDSWKVLEGQIRAVPSITQVEEVEDVE